MLIKNHKTPEQTYSFRRRMFHIVSLIFLFSILIIIFLSSYFTGLLRQKTYNNIKDSLQLYNNQLSDNLEDLDVYLFDMNTYSTDISLISSKKNISHIYNNIMSTKNLLNHSLPSFTEIDGMFVYAPINDTYIQAYKTAENSPASNYIRDYLRDLNSNNRLNEIETNSWFTWDIDHSYYFLRIIKVNQSYLGAWANVDQLTSTFKNISDLEGNIIYVDANGKPLSENQFSDYTFDIAASLNNYTVITMKDHTKALLVINEQDYCNYYLAALIPLKNVDVELNTIYQVLFVMALVILVLTFLLVTSVSRFLSKPLKMLENAATTIRSGNFETKMPEDKSSCTEIIEIDHAFNNMIDEIHNLRIDIYEEKIAKSQIELQYLKSQIAPHFLINCLYSISTMAADTSTHNTILQKMIQTLSEHLRYTLSDQNTVSLKDELMQISNYIELTKIRFPGFLTYENDIAPETMDAAVFPLILLMFTENTIKYNMVMGEPLEIKISSELILNGEEKRVHLTHIDSGEGFTPNLLKSFNPMDSSKADKNTGNHLGIRNVAKRLELVYDKTATIHLSNEPGWGARIDIEIPYLSYDNEVMKQHR